MIEGTGRRGHSPLPWSAVALIVATAAAAASIGVASGSAGNALVSFTAFTICFTLPIQAVARMSTWDDAARTVAPPGLPLIVLAVAAVTLLVIGLSAPWADFEAFGALVFWAAVGLAWIVKLGAALATGPREVRRRWRRWLLPFAIGVLGFVLAASDVPFLVRFQLSRGALDDAANGATRVPGQAGPYGLGLFDAGYGMADDSGATFLVGAGSSYNWWLVRRDPTAGPPEPDESVEWRHLDGNWWLERTAASD